MATTITTFRVMVDHLIAADDDELSRDGREDLIQAAVARYSSDFPDAYSEDVSGDGGNYYAMSSLTNWSEGFSRITEIEYPAATVASDEQPQYLERDDWRDDYWAEISGTHTRHFYLPSHAPAATDTMRVTYTRPYAWTSSPLQTTTPSEHFYAICKLAACLCCRAIATKYSRTSDSTILGDAVDHPSRAREFAERAREYCEAYQRDMNLLDDDENEATGEFVDWDTFPPWPAGREFIFHGSGRR